MNNQNSEEINGYIQFYNEIKKVILPLTYDEFQEKLKKMLQIESDLISSLIISYRDEDNDRIMVNTNEDYSILLEQIKNKQVNIITVEKEEKSNIDIDTCSQSLIKFKEKSDKNNEANNNLNIVSNQQFEINKQENKIEIINNNNKNNKDNDNDINNNVKNNINNLEEINNELEINNNKDFINNIDNNLNDSNSEEEIISPYLQKEKEQKNNLNNNINIINQINDINANANINLNQTYLVFNITCGLCNQYPIIKILYYCPTCSVYICPECEKKPDINHRHSILKVQTQQQFEDLMEKINKSKSELNLENNNKNQLNLATITDNIKDIKDSVLKIFKGNKEDVIIPQHNITQQLSLIQIARAQYGLEGISDEQLQDAIRKTNGNIENAIPLLFK